MRTRVALATVIVLLAAPLTVRAAESYVGPMGSASNKGTEATPRDLKSAMEGAQGQIRPSDTVWLGMATYMIAPPTARGWERAFHCKVSGTQEKPIVFRAQPGERVTIDGAIWAESRDVWFSGLEVMTSAPNSAEPEDPDQHKRPEGGFNVGDGTRCKFINCIAHDNNQGFNFCVGAVDAEIYGCLIYHNGWPGQGRGHGHGIYTQNKDGTKRLVDNVLWGGYAFGIHCYGSAEAYVDSYDIEGNILFCNGYAASRDCCASMLVGGGRPSWRIAVVSNVAYLPPVSNRVNVHLHSHYQRQVDADLVCRDNYFAGGRYALALGGCEKITGSRNTLWGRGLLAMVACDTADPKRKPDYSWDSNTYILGTWPTPFEQSWLLYRNMLDFPQWQQKTRLDRNSRAVDTPLHGPAGVSVIVRPNQYEPARANVAALNSDALGAVALDLSNVLKPGQAHRIFNVQKLWDAPVASGTYDGKPVAVPMLMSRMASDFDAFLVLPGASGAAR